jgi:hypothetical protein
MRSGPGELVYFSYEGKLKHIYFYSLAWPNAYCREGSALTSTLVDHTESKTSKLLAYEHRPVLTHCSFVNV